MADESVDAERARPDCGASVFRDGVYHNIGGVDITPKSGHAGIFSRFFLEDRTGQEPKSELPIIKRTGAEFAQPPSRKTKITWLGHSAMLIEMEGYRILTDPSFSDRASPISWAGPKRFHPPPLPADETPPIDVLLISHNHYDHLDYETIMKLEGKVKKFLTPLKVGETLVQWGISREKVEQLDWWGEYRLDEKVTFALTPAQHFSARGIFDRNKALWGSWVIAGEGSRVYFSGDSGMFGCYKQIGRKYGPFDFTLMHIGAYADVWPLAHLTPEEAAQAHIDLRGKVFVPMHWGTYRMAFHPWKEPAERFYKEALRLGIQFSLPVAGQTIENPESLPQAPWWRDLE
ncbi:MAG: MBL fold metallo-hydrolase [Nitrospinota bacterium]|nr:MBL fold metallo-hydrolase [Nitrospinota bacterium]